MNKATCLKLVLILVIGIIPGYLNAQNITSTKVDSLQQSRAEDIFFELYGPGLTISANYDTRFSQKRDGLGMRIGVGYDGSNSPGVVMLPIQVNYLIGKNTRYLELGVGLTLLSANDDGLPFNSKGTSGLTIGTMTFGYRYQPVNSGFSFRVSLNELFNNANFIPYAGVSFGYTFRKP
ncbi:MAG TPA: hypothetical protein VNW95_05055 [Mucilaginibacter sp.]|jgi:hypothetical protein|nr:hypothetical protein [Mucilaginibacter sp.]